MLKIIGEVSSNHNQSLQRAKDLILEAKRLGFDSVKFQLFKIEQLFSSEILERSSLHRARRQWELPQEWLPVLYDFSRKHNDHKLITWMKLDIQDICKKFSDSYFDAIVCFETLEHIEKGQEKVLSEFKKISKAAAPIITSVPYDHPDTKWHKRLFNFKQRDEMYKSIFSKYEYPKENASLVLAWNTSDE